MEVANLPIFLQFVNTKKSDICVIFAKKIMSGHETRGLGAKLGGHVPSGLGLKLPLLAK